MMKDMIDKRNERERIARSIIKYWNVNYIPRTQADSGMQKQTAEAENAQDQTMDPNMQEDYNKATNAYSGKYGQEKDLDEVTKDQIANSMVFAKYDLRHLDSSAIFLVISYAE